MKTLCVPPTALRAAWVLAFVVVTQLAPVALCGDADVLLELACVGEYVISLFARSKPALRESWVFSDQSRALLILHIFHFRSSTNITYTGWNAQNTSAMCSWTGITCDGNQRVTEIYMYDACLKHPDPVFS